MYSFIIKLISSIELCLFINFCLKLSFLIYFKQPQSLEMFITFEFNFSNGNKASHTFKTPK